MDASLRPADPGDRDLLLALMREYYAHDRLPLDEPRARTAVERLLADPACGRAWVIEAVGAPVGYVVLAFGFSLEYLGRDAFVDEIYLRPEARGRGVGRQALERVEAEARALGVQALHLEVERRNTDAAAVYRRAGFEDSDRSLMTKWLVDRPGRPATG